MKKTVYEIAQYFKDSPIFSIIDMYAFRALIADYLSEDADRLLENAFFSLSRIGYGYKYWQDEEKRKNARVFARAYFDKNKIIEKHDMEAYVTAINVWLLYFDSHNSDGVKIKLLGWRKKDLSK